MKKFTIPALLFFITSLQIACTNTSGSEKIYSAVLGSGNAKTKLAPADVRLLVDVYASSLFKMSLANEALVRSISPEANHLAKNINSTCANINAQVEAIAEDHDFTLPMDLTDEQKVQWKDLVKQQRWNFDTKFAEMIARLSDQEKTLLTNTKNLDADKNVASVANNALTELSLQQTLLKSLTEKIKAKTEEAINEENNKLNVSGSESKIKKKIKLTK